MASLYNRPRLSVPPGLPWWVGILPWVAFGVAHAWWPPLAAPLALAVIVFSYSRTRSALPPLDAGIAVYFLIYSVISLTGLEPRLPPRILFALCPSVLALTAALSVALGQPFTLAYARVYAPSHVIARPAFFLANQIISLLWVAGFATAAVAIGTMPGVWKPAQAALIFIGVMGATTAASVVIGICFHVRESRVAT
jgi:hypothetical protein